MRSIQLVYNIDSISRKSLFSNIIKHITSVRISCLFPYILSIGGGLSCCSSPKLSRARTRAGRTVRGDVDLGKRSLLKRLRFSLTGHQRANQRAAVV